MTSRWNATNPPPQYQAELMQLRADVLSMAMRIERALGIEPGGPQSAIRTREQRRRLTDTEQA